jgi:hypothetical protein
MLKKILVSVTIFVMILALASVSAVGAKGGKPTETPPPIPTEIPDTGDLYGDLYVILRDEYGVPIWDVVTLEVPETEEGDAYTVDVPCIQPITTENLELYDYDEGTGSFYKTIETDYLSITIYPGEPFVPPSYVDDAGDVVECGLSLTLDLNDPPTEDPSDDTLIYDLTPYVQAVDFGRLNLGRAPDAVIAHGFDEAVNKMNSATDIELDPAGRLMLLIDGTWKTIDAPAENLALYVKMMLDGHWITLDTDPVEPGGGGGKNGGPPDGNGPPEGDGPSTEPRPVLGCFDVEGNDTPLKDELDSLGIGGLCDDTRTNLDLTNQELQLAASLLAAAADKSGTFTLDSVIYINSVYGINQTGTLLDEVGLSYYFDFGGFSYGRGEIFGNRSSGDCGDGSVWVLQPDDADYIHFTAQCMQILGYDPDTNPFYNAVRFNNFVEDYDPPFINYPYDANVRGFAQSADDALRVIEYIHNYKVPEVLYE